MSIYFNFLVIYYCYFVNFLLFYTSTSIITSLSIMPKLIHSKHEPIQATILVINIILLKNLYNKFSNLLIKPITMPKINSVIIKYTTNYPKLSQQEC
jgi:hypothetical protein